MTADAISQVQLAARTQVWCAPPSRQWWPRRIAFNALVAIITRLFDNSETLPSVHGGELALCATFLLSELVRFEFESE